MSGAPRRPLLRRVSPRTRAAAAWSGVGLLPFALFTLFAMVAFSPRDPGLPLSASAYSRRSGWSPPATR